MLLLPLWIKRIYTCVRAICNFTHFSLIINFLCLFRGPEQSFGRVSGVTSTMVGYTGGRRPYPVYRALGDHTESTMVTYDPDKVCLRVSFFCISLSFRFVMLSWAPPCQLCNVISGCLMTPFFSCLTACGGLKKIFCAPCLEIQGCWSRKKTHTRREDKIDGELPKQEYRPSLFQWKRHVFNGSA